MKLYQIVETSDKNNDAGTKAVQDAAIIAENVGLKPVYIKKTSTEQTLFSKVTRQVNYCIAWRAAYRAIELNSVVMLQNPFRNRQLLREQTLQKLKTNKNAKFVSLIHDVEELRQFMFSDYYKHEFEFMLKHSDVFIVHNEKMADFFIKKGVSEEKIVVLEIFDYLQSSECKASPEFVRQITVAGNLDTKKCAYLGQLKQLKGIDIQLYGPNFDKKMKNCENIYYGGSLPPDKIPEKLTSGFGLVWDGTSIDGCKGETGEYLRYNNPHKLSLYLSSGLPVVIWSGAAEANFVKKYGVGIVVDTLFELPSKMAAITEEDYINMQKKTTELANKLVKGYFMETALRKALKKIETN